MGANGTIGGRRLSRRVCSGIATFGDESAALIDVEEIIRGATYAGRWEWGPVGYGALRRVLLVIKQIAYMEQCFPEIALASGSTTLKGTASFQDAALEAEAYGIQRELKRFHEQVLFPALGVANDITLNWKPLKPKDIDVLSARLRAEIEAGIITPEYAVLRLGYDREEMVGTFYQVGAQPTRRGKTPDASSPEGTDGA